MYRIVDNEDILKYFGFEKATQVSYKENNEKDVSTIINGEFTYDDMIKILDKFIHKYICCPSNPLSYTECTYPEMHLKVNKQRIVGSCDSCGFAGELDNVHKVASFIVKNPPKGSTDGPAKKGKEPTV